MKRLFILISIFTSLVSSCRKELHFANDNNFLSNVRQELRSAVPVSIYSSIDFSRIAKTEILDSIIIVRVGFTNKDIATDFILLRTKSTGHIMAGQLVKINGSISKHLQFNGTITIADLSDAYHSVSKITGGYIQHNSRMITANSFAAEAPPLQQDPYEMLPEVVVVSTYYSSGGSNYIPIYCLSSFFTEALGGGSGWYSSGNPYEGVGYPGGGGGGGGYGDGGTTTTNAPVVNDPPIMVDYETYYDDAAIDLNKFLKCFDNIPDNGAMASITISTDIPVNGDPNQFFDWSNGSPGHTFITLQKSDGGQMITQHIGFYPVSGWKTVISPAPSRAKFVNNGGHEYNASLSISLRPAQLRNAIIRMQYLARFVRYDIDDYNCTDWALDIFNNTVTPNQGLTIPKFDIPGGESPNGTNTPQGLYIKLQQMQQAGGSQALGVNISGNGVYASDSKGPCN